MPNTQKREIVSTLSNNLNKETSFAILQHSGLSHQKLEELRKTLFKVSSNVKIQIAKNSLLNIAIARFIDKADHKNTKAKSDLLAATKQQNSLLVMDSFWSQSLAAIKKFAKDMDGVRVKFGYVDGNFYDSTGMGKLADLPSREMLIAKLLSSFKSPSSRVVSSIKSPMQKLVYVLSAASKTN